MIWRDDDVSYLTDLKRFKMVHDIFNQYQVKHTIAVIAKDLEKNPELIEYIKRQDNIEVQLHCWEHIDFTDNAKLLHDHFRLGSKTLMDVFGKYPTILYPPWNRANEETQSIASKHGLTVSNVKISLSQYVRTMGTVGEDVVNFHYWADEEVVMLEVALKIFTTKASEFDKNKCK